MKSELCIIISLLTASFTANCFGQKSDSTNNGLNGITYELKQTLDEGSYFTLDTNGYKFQVLANAVLANIAEYENKEKNTAEDSLLMAFIINGLNENAIEINANKINVSIKKRLLHHIAFLITMGECRIVQKQNKEVLDKIVIKTIGNKKNKWRITALDNNNNDNKKKQKIWQLEMQ
jgi:hypothetical protein